MKQITIFDIIEVPIKDIPCGYIDDMSLIGRELRFNELKNLIGKKCVIACPRQSAIDYKVIKIMDYWEDHDKIYRQVKPLPENCLHYSDRVNGYIHDVVGQDIAMECYEVEAICDRVGYADQDKYQQSNSWVSEMYCSNGRFEPIAAYSETFYELAI